MRWALGTVARLAVTKVKAVTSVNAVKAQARARSRRSGERWCGIRGG
jgi:hypothetical protein